jgi:hypothetical protein
MPVESDTDVPADTDSETDAAASMVSWIDTHAHPVGVHGSCMTEECVESAVATMDAWGVAQSIFLHPPAPVYDASAEADVRAAVAFAPDRLVLGSGGNMLNALIQQTPDSGAVSDELLADFALAADELMSAGDVVAFGEIAALHLSYEEEHAFEETLPNTPVFELLADISAESGIPVDLHMDVVAETMATPAQFLAMSDNNPTELQGNVDALEELLEHNSAATIVWVHVGRDTTGDMTAGLVDGLMAAHENLVVQLHPVFGPLGSDTAIVDESGTVQTEWLEVLEAWSDRIVIGSDNFYAGTEEDGVVLEKMQSFLQQLPEDLAWAIGCQNPVALYGLPTGCTE